MDDEDAAGSRRIDVVLGRGILHSLLARSLRRPGAVALFHWADECASRHLVEVARLIDLEVDSPGVAEAVTALLDEVKRSSAEILLASHARILGAGTGAKISAHESGYVSSSGVSSWGGSSSGSMPRPDPDENRGELHVCGGVSQPERSPARGSRSVVDPRDLDRLYGEVGLAAEMLGHGERSDHIAVECELLRHLANLEAESLALHRDVRRLRRYRATFLRDHLCRFGPDFARRLETEADDPTYRRLGALCSAFFEAELRSARAALDRPDGAEGERSGDEDVLPWIRGEPEREGA